jgi:catechol 2,3-dioxygenase-like lactoylglutathione lyase family enzyme
MTTNTKTRITSVRTIGVPVSDQDRALDFYVEKLGLEKRLDAPVPQLGGRWIEVGAASSATTLALIPESDDVPSGVETGIRLATEDADAVHANLRSAGVDVGEVLRWEDVPPMFALRDPDGNGLEVVETVERPGAL